MPTAILSALPEEQTGLSTLLHNAEQVIHAGRTFWVGEIHGQRVVLALSGIGKVAAATTATALIERFGVRRIVFTGVAGGLQAGVHVGDVVLGSSYVQHDMDASPIFPRFVLPSVGKAILDADADLVTTLLIAAQAINMPATGINTSKKKHPQRLNRQWRPLCLQRGSSASLPRLRPAFRGRSYHF